MAPLIAGILSLSVLAATFVGLLARSSGNSVDREYEDQQQIKFLEEWKQKKKK